MCANGVPKELMKEIFVEAVQNIKGMRGRVKSGQITKEDFNTMGLCSDVSYARVIQVLLLITT